MTTVLVAGGAGGVGEGIVRSWLAAGATVAVPSRDPERLSALAEATASLPGALVTAASLDDPAGMDSLLDEVGPLDQAVASIGGGGWQLAPLLRIEEAMLRRIVEDGIVAHWATAKALVPRVKADGEYVFINGGAALQPFPGGEPMSLVARAQLTLADLVAGELGDGGPRLTSLILNTPIITRTRPTGRPGWLTADDVGQACVALHDRADLDPQIVLTTRADVAALGQD